MNREDKNLSKNSPEISAIEAALAQLRPRREARFSDELKSQAKMELLGESLTTRVNVPLTHYIRIAQFNAAASGLILGLLLGLLIGGFGVFFTLQRADTETSPPTHARDTTHSPFVRMLLVNEASLTPQQRAFFDELEQEIQHGSK